MKTVTVVLVAAGYCKRTPPTMKQIKNYLKGVHSYKGPELNHLNQENIVSEFRKLVRARKGVIKPEKVSPVKRETAKKPKPRLKGKKRKPEFTAPKKKRVKQESTF